MNNINFDDSPIKVSIVIVCMNNLKNLYPCLESIKKYTTMSYETLVVAYLFTKDNLEKVKRDFPWVTFIESNEIRGFSENNNLALRQAKGKYCFVLNDDTILREGCIDKLVDAFCKLPNNVAIVSPNIFDGNGKLAVSGNPPKTWKIHLLSHLRIINTYKDNKWVMGKGLFQTYNIVGAAFMIKTDVFRSVGWFDEYYFFAPEDLALSTLLNKNGYQCWVNTDAELIHLEGMTSGQSTSKVKTCTAPASAKGLLYYYTGNKMPLKFIVIFIMTLTLFMQITVHFLQSLLSKKPNSYQILTKSNLRELKAIYSSKSPKELFLHYYQSIIH